ncbi:alpha-tocopherol transfer protein-like [Chironomus tepperi]|uniref:alpha-tocopherol transfer protein-like n=1 Tax=Chironomus tepperi TaxID=113505 RepID=UPI00391F9D3E
MSLLFDMFARFREILKSAYNYKEALDRENLTQENINLLREKLKNSKVVPQSLADKQLIFFLNTYKNDVDKSAALVETCYKLKKSAPEFFKDRIVDSKEIQNCLENQYYIALPVTPDNHILIYHSLKNTDPNVYNFDSAAKTFIMMNEAYNYYHGPRPEVIYLFDLKGLSLRYIFKPSVSSMRKGIKFLEGGMPYNIKAVHVFNTVSFIDWIIAIVKPLLNSELLDKLHLHHADLDYDKFHEQYVPKTHLPKEYGGTLGTLDELQQQSTERLMNLKDYFIYEEQQSNFEFDQFVDEHLYEIQNVD